MGAMAFSISSTGHHGQKTVKTSSNATANGKSKPHRCGTVAEKFKPIGLARTPPSICLPVNDVSLTFLMLDEKDSYRFFNANVQKFLT